MDRENELNDRIEEFYTLKAKHESKIKDEKDRIRKINNASKMIKCVNSIMLSGNVLNVENQEK